MLTPLIPVAFARTADHASAAVVSVIPQILLITGFICLFYFLIWRPQTKRQEEKKALLTALQVGDVVYTNGGIIGKITKLHDRFCQIEVAANLHLYVQKEAVVDLVPQGSLKALGFE